MVKYSKGKIWVPKPNFRISLVEVMIIVAVVLIVASIVVQAVYGPRGHATGYDSNGTVYYEYDTGGR